MEGGPVSVFDDPTPEPFAGTVRGGRFGPAEARALLFPAGGPPERGAFGALVVVLEGLFFPADATGGCVSAHVVLSVSRRASVGAVRIGPGRYALAPGGLVDASALLVAPGGAGAATRAISGWIEIEAIDTERVAGAAVVELAGGGVLSGWFDAPRTASIARA